MRFEIRSVRKVLVLIEIESSKSFQYPVIWLRDNCQCQECFDKATSSRKIDFETFNLSGATLRDAKVRLIGELL